MHCPLCKQFVQDKETLPVHYITSCVGYPQDAAVGQATDSPGSGATISGFRKARVTFLWKKSVTTEEGEIYLFSMFEQVKLVWQTSAEIFKSEATEVICGTYSDCQLVVSGELYSTKPIVIDQEKQLIDIQLQAGAMKEITAPQGDCAHRLVDAEGRAAGVLLVDPSVAITNSSHLKGKKEADATGRGDVSTCTTVDYQETRGQTAQVSHSYPPNGRPDDAQMANASNPQLPPIYQSHGPRFQEQLSDRAASSNKTPASAAGKSSRRTSQPSPWDYRSVQQAIANEPGTRSSGHRTPHADLADTRVQRLQAERDQFAVELDRYGHTTKQLLVDLEQLQARQGQLLQNEKDLERTVSELLGEKDVMEQTVRSTVASLQQQYESLRREAREIYQKNSILQQAQEAADLMKDQLQDAAADKAKAVETLRKVQYDLEGATKYNKHLKEELAGLMQERAPSTDRNDAALRLQEKVKHLEAEVSLQQRQQQEGNIREQRMSLKIESLRSNLEGLQLTNETLKEQLDQLEADRSDIANEKMKKETELMQTAKQYQEFKSKCSLLETDVKQREKEFDALYEEHSKLQNALKSAELQNLETEGVMDSLQNEKTGLQHEIHQLRKQLEKQLEQTQSAQREMVIYQTEVVEMKTQLSNQQAQLQQLADDKRKLTAQIEVEHSHRKQYEGLAGTLQQEKKKLDARCRDLQRQVEEIKKHSSKDVERLRKSQMKVTELEGSLTAMEQRLHIQTEKASIAVSAGQTAEVRYQEALKTVTQLTDERNELKQRLKTIECQNEQDKGTLTEIGEQLQQSVAECTSLKEQIQQLSKAAEDFEEEQKADAHSMQTLKNELATERQNHGNTQSFLVKRKQDIVAKKSQIQDLQSELNKERQNEELLDEKLKRKTTELSEMRDRVALLESKSHSRLEEKQKRIEELEVQVQKNESVVESLQSSMKKLNDDLQFQNGAYVETRETSKRYRTERNEARAQLEKITGKQTKRPVSPHLRRKSSDLTLGSNDKSSSFPVRHGSKPMDGLDRGSRDPDYLLRLNLQITERSRAAEVGRLPGDVAEPTVSSQSQQQGMAPHLPTAFVKQSHMFPTLSPVSPVSQYYKTVIDCVVMAPGVDGQQHVGTVLYCGQTKTGHSQPQVYVGVSFDKPVGNLGGNDGSCPYFQCKPKHGVLLPVQQVTFPFGEHGNSV